MHQSSAVRVLARAHTPARGLHIPHPAPPQQRSGSHSGSHSAVAHAAGPPAPAHTWARLADLAALAAPLPALPWLFTCSQTLGPTHIGGDTRRTLPFRAGASWLRHRPSGSGSGSWRWRRSSRTCPQRCHPALLLAHGATIGPPPPCNHAPGPWPTQHPARACSHGVIHGRAAPVAEQTGRVTACACAAPLPCTAWRRYGPYWSCNPLYTSANFSSWNTSECVSVVLAC